MFLAMNERGLEQFWGEILSRDKKRTRAAFRTLKDAQERAELVTHLRRMVSEEGWAEPQRTSARQALDALQPFIQDE
jgi:putative protein kinase ArgK-like GTPase of G3E family